MRRTGALRKVLHRVAEGGWRLRGWAVVLLLGWEGHQVVGLARVVSLMGVGRGHSLGRLGKGRLPRVILNGHSDEVAVLASSQRGNVEHLLTQWGAMEARGAQFRGG